MISNEKEIYDLRNKLEDMKRVLDYMIDSETDYGDEYTAQVLKDFRDKYW